MERRLAVHAGADDAQEMSGWPGTRITMAVVLAAAALGGAARTADARPKKRDAKAAFDRGVAAYQKGNFQGASEALGKSFELERDVDTLFAWAQSERKLEHCDKAIDLYQDLLTFNLPAANRMAVENKLAECRTILAQQAPPPPPSVAVVTPPPPAETPAPSAPAVTPPSAPAPVAVATSAPSAETPPPESHPAYVPWKDPYALGLFGAGVVGLGVGITFYASGASEHNKVAQSPTIDDARLHHDRENSRKATGVVLSGVGLLCVGGGVVWTVLHRQSGERRTVTGWLAPGGGGLAITGPF